MISFTLRGVYHIVENMSVRVRRKHIFGYFMAPHCKLFQRGNIFAPKCCINQTIWIINRLLKNMLVLVSWKKHS
jgi:hypothetical protein